MAKAAKTKKAKPSPSRRRIRPLSWLLRLCGVALLICVLIVLANRWVGPARGLYMRQEAADLGAITQISVPIEEVAPVMRRSVVAAEDANFCQHWGFDVRAIRMALDGGARHGASTLTQQTVKNVYLWQGRSWVRKALEAGLTPLVEAFWSKKRILEVYLNVAEFDEGVFGVEAAARHYFGVTSSQLSAQQAARLAAVLPDPKGRSASHPSAGLKKRARSIMDGAATIARDGRAACFED